MLKVPPKKWIKFGFKLGAIGAAIELAGLAGSYLFWRKLNHDQEFRQYCSVNYPNILEGYYKIGDFFDSEKNKELRLLDQQAFANIKTIEDQKIYLGGFTTIGYVLLKLTEPSQEKIKEIKGSRYHDPQFDDNKRRAALITQKLKEAAYSKDPIYLPKKKNKEEESQQQPTKREIN
ncbi:hypothetical protein PVAND_012555 [Polypedilum vanderplanki]|uniref:Transmembrane protein n=1 Tax=Polypedilum vanderplanki TaxID=319348 RepID=A0A9J6CMU1_POLVA|nr:hypothetical protein PVAND_012555 [Polypedilum vanderplanki]